VLAKTRDILVYLIDLGKKEMRWLTVAVGLSRRTPGIIYIQLNSIPSPIKSTPVPILQNGTKKLTTTVGVCLSLVLTTKSGGSQRQTLNLVLLHLVQNVYYGCCWLLVHTTIQQQTTARGGDGKLWSERIQISPMNARTTVSQRETHRGKQEGSS